MGLVTTFPLPSPKIQSYETMEALGLSGTLREALKRIGRCWTSVEFRATLTDTIGGLHSAAPQFLLEKEPSTLPTANVLPPAPELSVGGRMWICVAPFPVTLYIT